MDAPRERTIDGLRVVVHSDPASLAATAAREAAAIMTEAVARRGVAHVMFATGNSQLAFVDALVGATPAVPAVPWVPAVPAVPWERTVVFHMDEYVGVGADHPAGFRRWIRERIGDAAPVLAVHYLDGLADPAVECARYASLLAEYPLDLCCLGIGENGHLAFNDPPVANFEDPLDVKVVELDRACRQQQVGEGHFPNLAAVPRLAMTVTIPALLRARAALAIVPEGRKAEAVRAALLGPVSTNCPASALRSIDHATLHLDRDSAGSLPWG